MNQEQASRSVIRVGAGRGFVVQGACRRLVITAGHCLPILPPSVSFMDIGERTYKFLLSTLRDEPEMWAECLFVDPIADLAVLGPPDSQEFMKECAAYEVLVDTACPIRIVDIPEHSPALLMSLDNLWQPCNAWHNTGGLWIQNALGGIRGGMSGSPVITAAGEAIGVVCASGGADSPDEEDGPHTGGGPNPYLPANLPGWMLLELRTG